MIKSYKKISLLLLICLLFSFQRSRAQERTPDERLALAEIRVDVKEDVNLRIDNLQKKYRLRKIQPELVRNLKSEILDQLHQKAYYLAQIDSAKTLPLPGAERAILSLHVTSGQQFVIGSINWEMPDSIGAKYLENIHRKTNPFIHQPFTETTQNAMFGSVLKIFENNGYPLCKIETSGFELDSLSENQHQIHLKLKIIPGPEVKIHDILLSGETKIDPHYLKRVFHFEENEVYEEKRIQRYQKILKRQDFIKSTREPRIVMGRDSLFRLALNFEEASNTTFDGIVGYIPPPTNDPTANGYFTGLLNVGFRNVFGTARRLDVFWQKPDRFSEEFRIRYREPFLLGLPFHTGAEVHRLVRDTTYIEWEYALDVEIPFNENLSGLARLYNREVYPDSLASALLRYPQTRAVHTELGFRWDTRDDIYNPRQGLFLSALFDIGTQRNLGPPYLLEQDSLVDKTKATKVKGKLSVFLPLWQKQVLAFNLQTVLIGYQGQDVRLPDLFWFGGATTVRGYREQQFFGEKVGWLNSEFRFLLGPRSRFFAFLDVGYYSRQVPEFTEEYLTGYGLGLRFQGPVGVLQVDYGMAKGQPFREGKLHFRLINEF